MEELQNVSIHRTASSLIEKLQSMQQYHDILQKVQKLTYEPLVDKDNMRPTLEEALKKSGVETEIRNLVFHLVRDKFQTEIFDQNSSHCLTNAPVSDPIPVSISNIINFTKSSTTSRKIVDISSSQSQAIGQKAPPKDNNSTSTQNSTSTCDHLAYLKRAGIQWERRVRKSLNAMCNDLKISIQGQNRDPSDRDELTKKWEELSNYVIDLSSFRPVYAPKDLLEVLLSLKGPPVKPTAENSTEDDIRINEFIDIPPWEFSHIEIKVKTFYELRKFYSNILRHESYNSSTTSGSIDINEQCKRVLESNHAALCQHLLQKGNIPATYRGALWMHVLNSHVSEISYDYWKRLKSVVLTMDHIVDKLIFKDIQLTASNDDQYFVFEDVLYQMMLCFSRDAQIPSLIPSDTNITNRRHYDIPPSGVIPFHGICMFAAPFCYLYNSINSLYFTFRAFYTRYCHRLTTINLHPQGIVSLCLLFERLLQGHETALWMHFRDLEIKPIRIVFKWIMRAFSGHLPPDQLLVLWDLILGYDSLEIVPLFAVIVLSFRKESILQVSSLDCIEAILADLSSIKVMPLIQLTLSHA